MFKTKTNRHKLPIIISVLALTLIISGLALAQPTSPPPGGNINPDFNSMAITGDATNNEPALWIGMDTLQNAEITYEESTSNLTIENNSTENHPAQLMLDDNGNIGMNAGPTVTSSALEVQAFNPASVSQVVLGKYDTNNYGILGRNSLGVLGRGQQYGVRGEYDDNNYGNIGTNGTGVYGVGSTNGVKGLYDANNYGNLGTNGIGVYGVGTTYGVKGEYNTSNYGLIGLNGAGVYGTGTTYGVKGEYDANNYGVLGSSDTGLTAVGSTYGINVDGGDYGINSVGGYWGIKSFGEAYGIYSESNPTMGGLSDIGYGIYSKVYRGDVQGTYYSGFFEDHYDNGSYFGLYADVRSGDGFDLAEYIYDSKNNLEAADIVIADPTNKESAIKSSTPYDTSTLGVVSTDPHITMGMDLIIDEETNKVKEGVNAVKLALAGRVPMKVTNENGQIKPGDLLTTSSTPGYAMKWTLLDPADAQDFEELKQILAENDRRQNAIIGKAVDSLDTDRGTIVALLSL